ncbi:hypothetical protein C8Q74DRAFT_1290124 [Fomes fomentarius]|nr:hypothetical protein C8Q74DRAFT_1290124 [Fomes fomentarius]
MSYMQHGARAHPSFFSFSYSILLLQGAPVAVFPPLTVQTSPRNAYCESTRSSCVEPQLSEGMGSATAVTF